MNSTAASFTSTSFFCWLLLLLIHCCLCHSFHQQLFHNHFIERRLEMDKKCFPFGFIEIKSNLSISYGGIWFWRQFEHIKSGHFITFRIDGLSNHSDDHQILVIAKQSGTEKRKENVQNTKDFVILFMLLLTSTPAEYQEKLHSVFDSWF